MRDLAGARAEDVQFLIVAGSGCEVAGLVLFLMGHADLWHASPLSFVIYVNITDTEKAALAPKREGGQFEEE